MLNYLYIGLSVVIALVLHELAHGFVSYKLGDLTPKNQGRLTLNPLQHLDLLGTLCLFIFHFGWAKPVQINPMYYKNKKKGTVIVSLAGPFMNFLIAFVTAIIIKIFIITNITLFIPFLKVLLSINVGLGVFNLIPIPPLDGSKVLSAILPQDIYFKYMQYEQFGMFFLLILLTLGVLTPILTILTSFVYNLIFFIVGL